MGGQVMVTLGDHTLPIVPQRHAYLQHELGGLLGMDALESPEQAAKASKGRLYEVLCVLMPGGKGLEGEQVPGLAQRMPEYEFMGYASREDWEAVKADREAAATYRRAREEWEEQKRLGVEPQGEAPTPPEGFVERYDREADRSPTPPQIIDVFRKAFMVNGGDIAELLGKYVGPEMIRAAIKMMVGELVSKRFASLPSTSGESDSTSSGIEPPTPSESSE